MVITREDASRLSLLDRERRRVQRDVENERAKIEACAAERTAFARRPFNDTVARLSGMPTQDILLEKMADQIVGFQAAADEKAARLAELERELPSLHRQLSKSAIAQVRRYAAELDRVMCEAERLSRELDGLCHQACDLGLIPGGPVGDVFLLGYDFFRVPSLMPGPLEGCLGSTERLPRELGGPSEFRKARRRRIEAGLLEGGK